MPRNSFYGEALALDEELAVQLAEMDLPPFTHRFSEWSPEAELLAAAVELLQSLRSTLIAAHKGKPDPVVRWPRPVPAAVAARRALRWDRHHDLARRLTSS